MRRRRMVGHGLRAVGAVGLLAGVLALGAVDAAPAAAATRNQVDVGPDVNCNLAGLHQNAGPVSTCGNLTIVSEVLVNGADVGSGAPLALGDTVTVRLTVTPRGGSDAFYQETVDGIRNNNRDLRFAVDVGLPGETGTILSVPKNVTMSRTDNGDRGNAPLINCLAHNGQEAAVTDGPSAVVLGGGPVGGTQMSAAVAGTTLTARWDQMAYDRCVNVLSNNGYYAGHTISFDQTVDSLPTGSPRVPTWSFGQVEMQRKDGSARIRWGSNQDVTLTIPPLVLPAGAVAVDDHATMDAHYAGQVARTTQIDVLANDTGNGTRTITAVGTPASGGTVDCGALPGTGPCTYAPPEGFAGTDTFTYALRDEVGPKDVGVDHATVHVLVRPDAAPDADDDLVVGSIGSDLVGKVTANDADADGDDLVVTATPVAGPTSGSLVLAADGTFTYTPVAGGFGTDAFTYEVCGVHPLTGANRPQPAGGTDRRCSTATATLVVDPGEGPKAVPDTATIDAGATRTLAVLANDDAGATGPVTVVDAGSSAGSGTTTAGGTVTCGATTCTYAPKLGFAGTDAFTYTIEDALGRRSSAVATVVVVGNHPPIALGDAGTVGADGGPLMLALAANDTDVDGDALAYDATPVDPPSQGAVTIAADGTATYVPGVAASGTDSFTYRVCDDHRTVAGALAPACRTATVTITIEPTPLVAPVAVEDGATTDEDVAVAIDVLANDRDDDGDPGALVIGAAGYGGTTGVTQAGGAVDCGSLPGVGPCSYTPPLGFTGTDAFTYTATDADGLSAASFVLVRVVGNQPPVPADDLVLTPRGKAVAGHLEANDREPDGEELVYATDPVSGPKHGTVTIEAEGTFSYVPDDGYTGVDQFVYEVCDDHQLLGGEDAVACAQATATVLVGFVTKDELEDAIAAIPEPPSHHDGGHGGHVDRGTLARTGTDLAGLVGAGLACLVVGASFVGLRRWRAA